MGFRLRRDGNDIALRSADIAREDLRVIPDAMRLSTGTLRVIPRKPAVGVRLQHRGTAAGRARLAQPGDRGCGHVAVVGAGRVEKPAPTSNIDAESVGPDHETVRPHGFGQPARTASRAPDLTSATSTSSCSTLIWIRYPKSSVITARHSAGVASSR